MRELATSADLNAPGGCKPPGCGKSQWNRTNAFHFFSLTYLGPCAVLRATNCKGLRVARLFFTLGITGFLGVPQAVFGDFHLARGRDAAVLESRRGRGRDECPVSAMWRALVSCHESSASLRRELRRHPALFGFDPHLLLDAGVDGLFDAEPSLAARCADFAAELR